MPTKLETETSAAKTIQAYKDAATQIGLVLISMLVKKMSAILATLRIVISYRNLTM